MTLYFYGGHLLFYGGHLAMSNACCCGQCLCTEAEEFPICYLYDSSLSKPYVPKSVEVVVNLTPTKNGAYTGPCIDLNGTYTIPAYEFTDDAEGNCEVAYYRCKQQLISGTNYSKAFLGVVVKGQYVSVNLRAGTYNPGFLEGNTDTGWVRQNPAGPVLATGNDPWAVDPAYMPFCGSQINAGYSYINRLYTSNNLGATTSHYVYDNTGDCQPSCNVAATWTNQPTNPYALSSSNNSAAGVGSTCIYTGTTAPTAL